MELDALVRGIRVAPSLCLILLKFSYQVKGNSSGSRLTNHGMNCVVTLQGWFSLKFIRAWIRVYFPLCAGQDARVSSLWFMGRCFSRLPRRWLKAQGIRSRISPPRISSFFLKSPSHEVENLKFRLTNV